MFELGYRGLPSLSWTTGETATDSACYRHKTFNPHFPSTSSKLKSQLVQTPSECIKLVGMVGEWFESWVFTQHIIISRFSSGRISSSIQGGLHSILATFCKPQYMEIYWHMGLSDKTLLGHFFTAEKACSGGYLSVCHSTYANKMGSPTGINSPPLRKHDTWFPHYQKITILWI